MNFMSLKVVIDTGPMISLSTTCLMNVFREFVKYNDIELLVPTDVAMESVWNPITNKKFALNAARIKYAFSTNSFKVIKPTPEIAALKEKILYLANNSFYVQGKPLSLLQLGESEALAIAIVYGANALFIDERTTRSLIENPSRLKEVLEKRQNQEITMNQKNITAFREMFPNLKMFRSVDIIALSYEQDLFDHELEHTTLELEASLYATKFSGCAVSEKEIEEYLALVRKQKIK